MTTYHAPLDQIDAIFAGLDALMGSDQPDWLDKETRQAILTEAAHFSQAVLAPLNKIGDREGVCLDHEGIISMPSGFKEAYQQFCEQGWSQAGTSEQYGGQPLPMAVMVALHEIFNSDNTAFSLLPMLNYGAIAALEAAADESFKETFLPSLISGQMSAAMVLTEADAGSDLSQIRTRAVKENDGYYRIFGQKQFITYGDHDLTDNILHLVIVRTSHLNGGLRGLSLMAVPKRLPDGSLNCWRCLSLEHKMGIHASPTATIVYGEGEEGAIGYLVGKAGRGLEYFYLMMRLARLFVAVQGVGLSEAACQRAEAFARERVQGSLPGSSQAVTIIHHPDVVRMISEMKAKIRAMRAGLYRVAAAIDRSIMTTHEDTKAFEVKFAELMIPTLKAFCTDQALDITSMAIQVFGGIGYIEETGIEQYYRDARIGPIYEGTNGIQAIEVVMRQVGRDRGQFVAEIIQKIRGCQRLNENGCSAAFIAQLHAATEHLQEATEWVGAQFDQQPDALRYAASDYLTLLAIVVCGWQLGCVPIFGLDAERDRRHYQDTVFVQAKSLLSRIITAPDRWALGKETLIS